MTPKSSPLAASSDNNNSKRQPGRGRGRPKTVKEESFTSLPLWKRRQMKTCLFCGQTYQTYANLEMHMNIHTAERPYQCDFCDDTFSFLAPLNTHRNNVHLGIRYSCTICKRTFTTNSNLLMHKRKHITVNKLKKLAKSGFAKSIMKKTIVNRLSSEMKQANVKKGGAENVPLSQLQPEDASNSNIVRESEVVTSKGMGIPIRMFASNLRPAGASEGETDCKTENVGQCGAITPILPPSEILMERGTPPPDHNDSASPLSSSSLELKRTQLLAMNKNKVLVVKLKKVNLSKITRMGKLITTTTSESVQKENESDVEEINGRVEGDVKDDEEVTVVDVEEEKEIVEEIKGRDEILVEYEDEDDQETIVDVEEDLEVDEEFKGKDKISEGEDDDIILLEDEDDDVKDEENIDKEVTIIEEVAAEIEKVGGNNEGVEVKGQEKISAEGADEKEIVEAIEEEEENTFERVEEECTINKDIAAEEKNCAKVEKEEKVTVGVKDDDEIIILDDDEMEAKNSGEIISNDEINGGVQEEVCEVVGDGEAISGQGEEVKAISDKETDNGQVDEPQLKDKVCENEDSVDEDNKENNTITDNPNITGDPNVGEASVNVDDNIEKEQQQQCKTEQMEVSEPENGVIKEDDADHPQINHQVPSSSTSKNLESEGMPPKTVQLLPIINNPQHPLHQFPVAPVIPPLSYKDKSSIPIVVQVDPITGEQTPFPPPFNPAAPANSYRERPNLFFSINGKLIMPLFSVEMFRFLGPLPASSMPTPTIIPSESDQESCGDEKEEYSAEEEEDPQPSTSRHNNRERKSSINQKVKRKRSSDSDSSWSAKATSSTSKRSKRYEQGPVKNGAHKCPHCPQSYNFGCHLSRHIFSRHCDAKPFSCKFCAVSYRQKPTLVDHIMAKHCEMNSEEENNIISFCCPFCADEDDKDGAEKYTEKRVLHNHIMKQHLNTLKVSNFYQNKPLASVPSTKPQPEKRQPMKTCSRSKMSAAVSKSSKVLKREKKRKTQNKKITITTSSSKKTKPSIRRHLPKTSTTAAAESGQNLLPCSFCDKVFNGAYNLNSHLTAEHGAKPYVCPLCSARFTRKDALVKHLMKIHGGVKFNSLNGARKKEKCPICNIARTRKELQRHISYDHHDVLMGAAESDENK